jgi:tRNA dimethylallyltransferase
LHPNDAQRIQRALEVHYLTGEPMSVLQQRSATEPRAWSLVKISIEPFDRERLHQRIERRFKAMLNQGLVEEVRGFYQRGDLHSDLPSMRSVGYRQVWDWLAGRIADDELVFRGVAATRQLARRQLTWLRREREVARVDADDAAVQDRLRDLLVGVLLVGVLD